MTKHDEIRELLALAAAGVLEPEEEGRLEQHLAACALCAAEMERWRELAGALRRMPTPQPSLLVVERARAQAEAELAARAEERWDRQVVVFLSLFSWTVVLASWPIVRLLTEGMFGWLEMQQTWLGLAAYTVMGWMGAGVAAGFLGWRQRAARRTV